MYVDPGILAVILGVVLSGTVALVTYLFRQVTDHAKWMAAANEREIADNDREKALSDRVREIERWRDAVQFGRAVERVSPTHPDGSPAS